jgi:hypothetical protein
MTALFIAVLSSLQATTRSRLERAAEILALGHQLAVLQRTTLKRPRLRPIDRLLWVLLCERLATLAADGADRDARHRGVLASARVRRLLALEFTTPSRRPSGARS